MKKVLVIAGPTAAGKTAFSIRLAKAFHAEIISGDSIQVYRGLDIGSGKVTEEEMDGVVHHLLDIRDPSENYSVSDFQKAAREVIDRNDSLSIICGGTGLYLKACLYDYEFEEEKDRDARDSELEAFDNETLWAMLKEKDPVQAEKIHVNNRVRLLRSLTILKHTGQPQSFREAQQKHEMVYDALILGCTMPRSRLHERINLRVEKMFEAGLEQEVRGLLEKGVTFQDPGMKGIGYREWEPYFQGQCSADEVKTAIQTHSRQFARRQYTWLNHQMPVHWFNILDEEETEAAEQTARRWYQ